jgi:hypothetical protein
MPDRGLTGLGAVARLCTGSGRTGRESAKGGRRTHAGSYSSGKTLSEVAAFWQATPPDSRRIATRRSPRYPPDAHATARAAGAALPLAAALGLPRVETFELGLRQTPVDLADRAGCAQRFQVWPPRAPVAVVTPKRHAGREAFSQPFQPRSQSRVVHVPAAAAWTRDSFEHPTKKIRAKAGRCKRRARTDSRGAYRNLLRP